MVSTRGWTEGLEDKIPIMEPILCPSSLRLVLPLGLQYVKTMSPKGTLLCCEMDPGDFSQCSVTPVSVPSPFLTLRSVHGNDIKGSLRYPVPPLVQILTDQSY